MATATRLFHGGAGLGLALLVGSLPANALNRAAGEALYQQHCVSCHGGAMDEAPGQEALSLYPPERIVSSLTNGIMSVAGLPLSQNDMQDLVFYLTGKTASKKRKTVPAKLCAEPLESVALNVGASWSNWGGGAGNRRFQSREQVITADNAATLELSWAFAFPDSTRVRSQPTVTTTATFIASQDGTVYALDSQKGCVHWTFRADHEVRGAINLVQAEHSANPWLLFGDFKAQVYALDAQSGKLRWKQQAHEHPLATITGSVAADGRRVYVPISSSEVVPAAQDTYPCCSFRGALVALELKEGKPSWTLHTTPPPERRGNNAAGTPRFGPSGAPIWSSPTLDPRRKQIIVTTGQNYSSPATGTSDAIIAVDAERGTMNWVTQVTAGDAWNGGCSRRTANCPEENGPDFDLGASAVLVTLADGRDLILAGQKSGKVYALDPEREGALLWTRRVGSGGTMGGVHWGMSSDGQRLYVGVSDQPTGNPYSEGPSKPGIAALDPMSGKLLWQTVLPNECNPELRFLCWPGVSAAVSSSPGLVFAGSLDGQLRAFDAETGSVLWRYNSHRAYEAVNGVPAQGGAIEADGPVIANGAVFVTSGYDKWGELPGNVLLRFAPTSP